MDVRILTLIAHDFNGGPVGIDSLASSLNEEPSTIEDVYEPFLVQKGFLQRSPKGRLITSKGKNYIK